MPKYAILSSTEGRMGLEGIALPLSAEIFWAKDDSEAVEKYIECAGESVAAEEHQAMKYKTPQKLYRIEWRDKLVEVDM